MSFEDPVPFFLSTVLPVNWDMIYSFLVTRGARVFPLPFVPELSYRHLPGKDGKGETNGRAFGAKRPNNRLHAACDLIAAPKTHIRAIEGGVVKAFNSFYSGTWALVVRHDSGCVVRYGEVSPHLPSGIAVGKRVEAGQHIASVGRLESGSSMLHFELYSGKLNTELTARENKGFQRRRDLLDPTYLLDRLALNLAKGHA